MYEDEYTNMYLMEESYWYYMALHELLEDYVRTFSEKNDQTLNIFDAGCGTGRWLTILEQYGKSKGIDYSPQAIKYCKMRGLNNVRVGNLNENEYGEDRFDIITCIGVLYCFAHPDEIPILKGFYRALKPGGMLLLDSPAFNCLMRKHDIVVGGKRRYRRSELIPILNDIGFKVEVQTYRLSFLFLPVWIKKYVEKLQSNSHIKSDLRPLPRIINGSLLLFHRIENELIKRNWNFPIGTSFLVVAKK
jgi:SAM-dependent methyltransferase